MRSIIIKLCRWILDKLAIKEELDCWLPKDEDGCMRFLTKSGRIFKSSDLVRWDRVFGIKHD